MEDKKNILVDARPLVDPNAGGVRRVAEQVLRGLIEADLHAEFTFVTTGAHALKLPEAFRDHPAITHVHIKWPNKLLSALLTLGVTSIDRLAARELRARGAVCGAQEETPRPAAGGRRPNLDAAILTNLGFVGFMEIPYGLILHDVSFLIHPKWFSLKGRLWHYAVNPREIARRADRVFTVSETTARDAERLLNIDKEKIEVFRPGTPKLKRQEETAHDARRTTHPYVIAFGEQDPRKNMNTAIAAVEQVRKEPGFENLSLVLTGSNNGTMEQWNDKTWITRLSLISDTELADLYKNASALLYPSWYEGFGLPLHEAARFGVPCLASTHGALPETAPEGTVFAPPMKPHLWAGMLRDMLLTPDHYRTSFDKASEEPNILPMREWLRMINRQ